MSWTAWFKNSLPFPNEPTSEAGNDRLVHMSYKGKVFHLSPYNPDPDHIHRFTLARNVENIQEQSRVREATTRGTRYTNRAFKSQIGGVLPMLPRGERNFKTLARSAYSLSGVPLCAMNDTPAASLKETIGSRQFEYMRAIVREEDRLHTPRNCSGRQRQQYGLQGWSEYRHQKARHNSVEFSTVHMKQ